MKIIYGPVRLFTIKVYLFKLYEGTRWLPVLCYCNFQNKKNFINQNTVI